LFRLIEKKKKLFQADWYFLTLSF